jgi:hypothetical protein
MAVRVEEQSLRNDDDDDEAGDCVLEYAWRECVRIFVGCGAALHFVGFVTLVCRHLYSSLTSAPAAPPGPRRPLHNGTSGNNFALGDAGFDDGYVPPRSAGSTRSNNNNNNHSSGSSSRSSGSSSTSSSSRSGSEASLTRGDDNEEDQIDMVAAVNEASRPVTAASSRKGVGVSRLWSTKSQVCSVRTLGTGLSRSLCSFGAPLGFCPCVTLCCIVLFY